MKIGAFETTLKEGEIRRRIFSLAQSNYSGSFINHAKFYFSSSQINLVETNGSYEIWKKSMWVGMSFHIISFQISEGETKTRIDYQAKLNSLAKVFALVFGSALFCFLTLGIVIQQNNQILYVLARFVAVPIVFSPFALVFWLTKRHSAKEGIWFLKDILGK